MASTATAVLTLRELDRPVHWVGGGKSKDDMAAEVGRQMAPLVASAHLFGAVAKQVKSGMDSAPPVTTHPGLEDALDAALRAAAPGDAVLFSPAFASFDQFPNFQVRARAFSAWLGNRCDQSGSGKRDSIGRFQVSG